MIQVPRPVDPPPPYTRASPLYSSVASSAASSLFSVNPSENGVYECGSKGVILRFFQHKRTSVRLPAYGRGGIVDGEVSLRSTSHIESISVSLKGEIKTVIESSCRPTVTSKLVLIEQSYDLWPLLERDAPVPHAVPFSFSFPSTVKGRQDPLPPSFVGALAEGTARAKYTIVVHVRRTGWRGNTTVEMDVFYLPHPIEAIPSHVSSSFGAISAPVESPHDMSVVELPVKQSTAGEQVSSEVKAHLACPLSIMLSRDHNAQFNLYLSSSTQPVERLLQLAPHISVRLVRTVTITARGLSTTEESTCAYGIIQTSALPNETEGQAFVAMSGLIQLFDTTWTSWMVGGASKITYGLRITLPPSFQPGLAYLDHTVPVLGLSGSCGSPNSPDLSLIPTPAALLKKPIGYMPMRV
ncbi:hypothetical protein FS749_000405 [Ceratobasidium sp. UAMH 11750]|nr:hypothetical protein FS749_000405 [Ceratobasidium sp. UAMH 11750]